MKKPSNPAAAAARELNAHHNRTCAGFYPSTGGRAFSAKSVGDALYISRDFGTTWEYVATGTAFGDHNGRNILTYAEATAQGVQVSK